MPRDDAVARVTAGPGEHAVADEHERDDDLSVVGLR